MGRQVGEFLSKRARRLEWGSKRSMFFFSKSCIMPVVGGEGRGGWIGTCPED